MTDTDTYTLDATLAAIDYAIENGDIPEYIDESAFRTFIVDVAGYGYFDVVYVTPNSDDDDDSDTVERHYEFEDVADVIQKFEDAYAYASDATEWAEAYIDSTGMLDSLSDDLRYYFDYERFGDDAESSGDISVYNGHVFYGSW